MAQQTALTEEHFGELKNLTKAFITACNESSENAALQFRATEQHILRNTDLEEDQAITTIFDEIVRISGGYSGVPQYDIGALTRVFASGYKDTDPVLKAIAHIGEARRAGKPAHLSPVN